MEYLGSVKYVINIILQIRYMGCYSHRQEDESSQGDWERPKLFQVGELVWKTILPLGTKDIKFGKWSPSWEGPYKIVKVIPRNSYMVESLQGTRLLRALNGLYLKKYYPSVWQDAWVIETGVFVRNHHVEAKYLVVCMFLDRCNPPKIGGICWQPVLADPAWSGPGGQTTRGTRSECLDLISLGRFRSSLILSLNLLFCGKHDSKSGKTTSGLYNEGLMANWGYPNRIY
jgi:hypothetical protein